MPTIRDEGGDNRVSLMTEGRPKTLSVRAVSLSGSVGGGQKGRTKRARSTTLLVAR